MPTNPNMSFKEENLVIERAQPPEMYDETSIIQIIAKKLDCMNEDLVKQWIAAIPMLPHFEDLGMFSKCQVTMIFSTGRAVVLLNNNLQVSIYKLDEIDLTDCDNIFKKIGLIVPSAKSTQIPRDTLQLTNKYRLRLECHRSESLDWMKKNSNNKLLSILNSKLQNYERDRLFTFTNTVRTAKAMSYITNVMEFVGRLNPATVSEMISYGEYAIAYVEAEKKTFESDLRNEVGIEIPRKQKKADVLRQCAVESTFNNPTAMIDKWHKTVAVVRSNSMVNPVALTLGLSNEELVAAIKNTQVGFSSETSAAYHLVKHPIDLLSEYVQQANAIVRGATRWKVTLTQDGDARQLHFESPSGSACLLERDGNVILCSYLPKSR